MNKPQHKQPIKMIGVFIDCGLPCKNCAKRCLHCSIIRDKQILAERNRKVSEARRERREERRNK